MEATMMMANEGGDDDANDSGDDVSDSEDGK